MNNFHLTGQQKPFCLSALFFSCKIGQEYHGTSTKRGHSCLICDFEQGKNRRARGRKWSYQQQLHTQYNSQLDSKLCPHLQKFTFPSILPTLLKQPCKIERTSAMHQAESDVGNSDGKSTGFIIVSNLPFCLFICLHRGRGSQRR